MENKLIKAVDTKRYGVELYTLPNHGFVVTKQNKSYGRLIRSEVIKDFSTASYLFDLAISDYERQ